jgi:polyhydroxyalkanoate synthase
MTGPLPSPAALVREAKQRAGDTSGRLVNGLRFAAGLDRPATGCTPQSVVWRSDRASLRRFRNAGGSTGAVFLVPSLINRSHIWDLRPGDSFVEGLLAAGYDVFLIDWGRPDERDADNTLSTYVDGYLPAAYQRAVELAGCAPVVIGHCFGGVMSVLWAASTDYQPPALVALATPTNWAETGPLYNLTRAGRLDPERVLDATGNVPPASMLRAFQMLRPLGDLAGWVTLWDRLHNRHAAQAIYALTDWAHDHVPFPGQTFVEMIRQISRGNAMFTGEVVLDGVPRKLSDIRCPFLNVYGTHDHVTPPASVLPLAELVGSLRKSTIALPAGHVGLLAGGTARRKTLPAVVEWLQQGGSSGNADVMTETGGHP